jgi:hypothetical protein
MQNKKLSPECTDVTAYSPAHTNRTDPAKRLEIAISFVFS